MKWIYLQIILSLFVVSLEAMPIKIRAREHFETHKIKTDAAEYNYKGLSNTINIWYEKPYNYSVGLSFSPLLGSAVTDDATTPTEFGEVIILRTYGIEAKYYMNTILQNSFIRLGLGYSELSHRGNLSKLSGQNTYYGIGYEYPFKNFGLALELAARDSFLSDNISVSSFTPSVGFHFYKML